MVTGVRRGVRFRRAAATVLASSLALVDVSVGVSRADGLKYSARFASVADAADVSQSVIDAHAADVASARGLENSRVVAADDDGPVPLPVGGAVLQPVDGKLFEPPLPVPPVDSSPPSPDPALSPPVSDRKITGFDPKTSVELRDRRNAFSTTYQNTDGTQAVILSSMPVHFEDGIGGWKNIDNRVVSDGNGGLTNTANAWHVTFGVMEPGEGVTITTPRGDLNFVADSSRPVGDCPILCVNGGGYHFSRWR